MPARNKPYEQFGPFILFKRLEVDPLGELWRAGRLEGAELRRVVALRRLTGGNRQALVTSAAAAAPVASQLSGTSFAKNQAIDVINGMPVISHDYAGGRSLRHIVDRARGGTGNTPNPIPIDQAIVIAERIALSLATMAEMKLDGKRLTHGALLPQFIWISDDGEIRVAGQQLGGGIVASLKDPKIGADLGRYFPPEYHASGEPSKTTDVYSMGAILYLLTTGLEPPDPSTSSAFAQTLRAAKTMTGEPMPDDVRSILEKSLAIDATRRFESIADMKQALSALAHGGKYSASTFNLAFYLSNLLKKEMEGEAIDREKEMKVNLTAYLEAPVEPEPAPAVATVEPIFAASDATKRNKVPMAIAAGVVVAAIGVGAVMMLRSKKAPQPASGATVSASAAPVAQVTPNGVVSEPVVVAPTAAVPAPPSATAPGESAATPGDAEAQRKAFEEAVRRKLQEEMMKLQSDYTRSLQQQQAKNAPVLTSQAAPAAQQPVEQVRTATVRPAQPERSAPSAEQLDQQRLQAARQEPPSTQAATPAPAPAVAQTQPPANTAAPAAPGIREGDVVDVYTLDSVPKPLSAIRTDYPPLAARQRIQGTVLLTILISESGQVLEVKVLKKVGFGLDEAAVRAIRNTRFSPPMKDGKRVKTWFPQPVEFRL